MMTQIEITCFAGLRKFFDSRVSISLALPTSYQQVLEELKKIRPEATEILDSCRVAVAENFVPRHALMTRDEPVFLIPPSSGG